MIDQFNILPPQAIEAEKCLIASLMLDQKMIPRVLGIVSRETFYQADHQIFFDALVDQWNAGKPCDAEILRAELKRRKLLDEVGGTAYMAELLNSVPSSAHAEEYARIVREKWMLRGVISAANESICDAYAAADHDNASDIVQGSITRLAKLVATASSTECIVLGEAVQDAYDHIGDAGADLVKTGIGPIDVGIGGIRCGEMLVMGARPSMGKSTLGRQIVASAAAMGTPTAIISLEESRGKIARNLLSAYSEIENDRIRRGTIVQEEWSSLAFGLSRLLPLPVYIADKAFRMSAIRSVAAMLVAKYGVKMIVLDYLQKIQIEGTSRFEKVTNASCEVSSMFKELNVAGIVLAQLNREVAHRENKRPGMFDLRESGQIEQDADVILFLHREDYYRATGESTEGSELNGVAELIKAKCRDGVRGDTITLRSNLKYQRFEEFVPEVA